MLINVIFDDRHEGDKQRLLKEFQEQGIEEYTFWNAIILNHSVVASINASHKRIVKWAKLVGLKEVVVAEQDLQFTDKGAWEFFLSNKPENYKLYLWGSYVTPISNNKVCGFQLYIIHESFYDKFLSVPDDSHIDTAMDSLNDTYDYCYPFPALQRPGFSANNKDQVNYNSILKKEDIYVSMPK